MRRAALAIACATLLSGPASGAPGDALMVIGDGVNVRSGPGTEHRIRLQISRNRQLVEIERQGEWVHVEITGAGGAEGWIHGSLVASPGGAPSVEQAAEAEPALASEPAPVEDLTDAAAAREAEPRAPEAIAPGAAPEVDAVDLQRFRDSVDYLNSRSMAVGGFELFAEVEPLGAGTVQIGATDAWASVPPAGQRSYANTLLDRWAAATGRSDHVKVQIVDPSGRVLMEESKP